MDRKLEKLLAEIRACRICQADLPLGPNPVLRVSPTARLAICAQAPGTKVHNTGLPFNDPSGDRLRHWMGVDRETFYDNARINIIPMGFCYPGRDPRGGGDMPPRPECSATWHRRIFKVAPKPQLTLAIGRYAIDYHLAGRSRDNLTETVRAWRDYWPDIIPLPHPSPRNIRWLKRNPWFEEEVVPAIREAVAAAIGPPKRSAAKDRPQGARPAAQA